VEDARDHGGNASVGGHVTVEDYLPVRQGPLLATPFVPHHQPLHTLRNRPVDRADVRPAGEPYLAEPNHHEL